MTIATKSIGEVLERIVPHIREHQTSSARVPFVLGLTGLQGSGKSTWAEALTATLEKEHSLKVVNVSLDDFYHRHDDLARVYKESGDNPLLRNRGQPGTHDTTLARQFFETLRSGQPISIPSFDKSRHNGEGDRVAESEWRHITQPPPVDVLLFEGWCVGFQPLDEDALKAKWELSSTQRGRKLKRPNHCLSTDTLGEFQLEHLLEINSNLQMYQSTFMGSENFNYLIHLDTNDLLNVYHWRLDQEHALLKTRGGGMSDDAVIAFVQGYMPSYELYLEQLRLNSFIFRNGQLCYLRVILDSQRNIIIL
ncbi:hypothetical protein G7046_g5977 [Stylonectria norvegica]|nr:hypothetical protein G7046_g5977 [Stylonectria norvegica]